MKWFRANTIKSKIILLFFLIACIVLLLQVVVFQHWISSIIMEKSDAYFQETIHQIGERVDLQVKQFNSKALSISGNQVVKNYLKDLENNNINYNIAKYRISGEIFRLSDLDFDVIDNICIYPVGLGPINFYYTIPIFDIDPAARELLNRESPDMSDEVLWLDQHQDPNQISIFITIHDDDKKLGLLRIILNKAFFSSIVDGVKLGKAGKVYFADDRFVSFAKEREFINQPISVLYDHDGTPMEYVLNDKKWRLIGVIPKAEIAGQINQFNLIFYFMVFVMLAAVMAFGIVTARILLRPLKKIMKGMESIQQGNLKIMLDNKSNDEFSMIIRHFNFMVEKVNGLIDTIYRRQLHYRKAEMLSLQAKLNPHFLYNTLDMIYWMAIMKEEDEIGDVIVTLSQILRYSISHKDEFVSVGEDMEQLENYLKIQRLRFEDKLAYSLQLHGDVRDVKIPKLIIQPLVENSIKYAFQDMKHGGSLSVSVSANQDDLIFEVADDGVGMSPGQVQSIYRSFESAGEEGGIGIKLVHQRIKYIFGEDCGFFIESAVGKGTKITVVLKQKVPFHREELLSG